MKCSKCGHKIKSSFKLCPSCGEKIEINEKLKRKVIKTLYVGIGIGIVLIVAIMLFITFLSNGKKDIADLKDSVVQIYVYGEDGEAIATGSGVVAFKDDLILTNAHVVEDNYSLEVISENNTKYTVEGIVAYNKKKDIAILKLKNSKGLKALKTKEKIAVGDEVTAIGSPLGLKNTVSDGILSGYFQDNIEVYQHTAPISSGSSGGALFDSKGNLVGITYASINGGQNLNLAIPIVEFKKEYEIVKNNVAVKSRYYSFLNNGILKTEEGNDLLDYVLNDKYSNEKFKSGVISDEDMAEGNLERCTSLANCSFLFKSNYKKINDYVSSSIYLDSGTSNLFSVSEDGTIEKISSGEGYSVVIIKLNNKSDSVIGKIQKFIEDEFEFDTWEFKNNSKYLYGFICTSYNECYKVRNILEGFVK